MWFKCNCKYGKCNAISTDRKKNCIEMKDVSNVNSFVSPSHFALKNSGQRQSPWLMTQGVKSNVILPDAVQLRGQSFNCLIVNLRMRHKKHLNFFSSDNKTYNIVQPKALQWQMRYKLSSTNGHGWPLSPHESTSEICACGGESGGRGVSSMSCRNYLYHKTVSKINMSVQKTRDVKLICV